MAEPEAPATPARESRFWRPGRRRYAIGLALLIVILLAHEITKPVTGGGERAFRILLKTGAVLLMGVALWLAQFMLSPLLEAPGLKFVGLALLVGLGMATYGLVGIGIVAFRTGELRSAFRR